MVALDILLVYVFHTPVGYYQRVIKGSHFPENKLFGNPKDNVYCA